MPGYLRTYLRHCQRNHYIPIRVVCCNLYRPIRLNIRNCIRRPAGCTIRGGYIHFRIRLLKGENHFQNTIFNNYSRLIDYWKMILRRFVSGNLLSDGEIYAHERGKAPNIFRERNLLFYVRNVQCLPFHPWLHTQVPFLHWPCSAQRESHGFWSHFVPVQSSWHLQKKYASYGSAYNGSNRFSLDSRNYMK